MTENKTIPAYICMGSNAADAQSYLDRAEFLLSASGLTISGRSGTWRTEPQDDHDQEWFRNRVIRIDFHCPAGGPKDAKALLQKLNDIEDMLGRVRDPARRFGPRTLDLDILLFGGLVFSDERLTVPHPRMAQRAFALVPLLEIDRQITMPDGTSAASLLARLPYRAEGDAIYQ